LKLRNPKPEHFGTQEPRNLETSKPRLGIMMALRFANQADADLWPSRSQRQRVDRIALGSLVAVVYGAAGACRQAIVAHIGALSR
jgi:hypothetical protein